MTDPKKHRTRSGRTLSDEEIDAIAHEVEETTTTSRPSRHVDVADLRWGQDLPTSSR